MTPMLSSSDRTAVNRSLWSFRIATIAGIPVRLHATFFLFLAWLGFVAGVLGVVVVLGLFVCVTLHEFGHALTARRYGIETRDVTLYPIGGVAALEGRLRAREELWVALAGPMVNVVLAAPLLAVLHFAGREFRGAEIVGVLATTNVAMAVFNMIPAFPMDGGRVLRALLARGMTDERATRIAAGVGQTLAVSLFGIGLFHGPTMLTIIAVFVFLGAAGERRAESVRAALAGHRLSEAMQTRFQTLSHGDGLRAAAVAMHGGTQMEFPVVVADEPIGIVSRTDVFRGLVEGDPDAYVASRMRRDLKVSEPDALLEEVVESFTRDDPSAVLVVEDGHLVGMVTPEDVGRFITREEARRRTSLL